MSSLYLLIKTIASCPVTADLGKKSLSVFITAHFRYRKTKILVSTTTSVWKLLSGSLIIVLFVANTAL